MCSRRRNQNTRSVSYEVDFKIIYCAHTKKLKNERLCERSKKKTWHNDQIKNHHQQQFTSNKNIYTKHMKEMWLCAHVHSLMFGVELHQQQAQNKRIATKTKRYMYENNNNKKVLRIFFTCWLAGILAMHIQQNTQF